MCNTSDYASLFFFFFNDTATTEIYTLSLHDALPISRHGHRALPLVFFDPRHPRPAPGAQALPGLQGCRLPEVRSEEHTSELQSLAYLVCRLLLEKKNTQSHATCPNQSCGTTAKHSIH